MRGEIAEARRAFSVLRPSPRCAVRDPGTASFRVGWSGGVLNPDAPGVGAVVAGQPFYMCEGVVQANLLSRADRSIFRRKEAAPSSDRRSYVGDSASTCLEMHHHDFAVKAYGEMYTRIPVLRRVLCSAFDLVLVARAEIYGVYFVAETAETVLGVVLFAVAGNMGRSGNHGVWHLPNLALTVEVVVLGAPSVCLFFLVPREFLHEYGLSSAP
ncbi:hypothetical protein C2E23DRAFT_855352 [Lenzites betulinus]|nr:hypothetical protein C2E23DRAFT_855352 [Lenzites betulinus]